MSSFKSFLNNKNSFWCSISRRLSIKLSMSFTGLLGEMMLKFVDNLIRGKVKKWRELMCNLIIQGVLDLVSAKLDRVLLIIFLSSWMEPDMSINLRLMAFGSVLLINNSLGIIGIMKIMLLIWLMLSLYFKFFKNN